MSKFYYKKEKNATQVAKKVCLWTWSARVAQSSSVFNLFKFWCKKCTSFWSTNHWKIRWNRGNVEQDRHISSHDIDGELNIDHETVLNHLEKTGLKKTRCLSATWLNSEKFNGSNFHLRIIAKMERNRIIFETVHYDWWKIDHVWQ